MKNFSLILISLFFVSELFAQSEALYTTKDKAIFDKYVVYIMPYRTQSIEKVLERTAEFFLETPYVAHTLEIASDETFVINLRELDCVTFVENVIALTETAISQDVSFDKFLLELRKLRYRNGDISDYASRLHYTSDWVHENEKRGMVKNISHVLGGSKEVDKIDFMSTHRSTYNQLKSDDKMWQKIVQMEDSVNSRGGFWYLPKKDILMKSREIPHMAMIAFVTSIEGLDTTHVGFIYKKSEKLTFIHASSAEKKVVIDKKTLYDYCMEQKSCKGIMVVATNLSI